MPFRPTELEGRSVGKVMTRAQQRIALQYITARVRMFPTLAALKQGMDLAHGLGETQLEGSFSDMAIAKFPNNSAGYVRKAKLLVGAQRPEEALRLLEEAPIPKKMSREFRVLHKQLGSGTLEPHEFLVPVGLQERAAASLAAGHIQAAMELAGRIIASFPKSYVGYVALSKALHTAGRNEEAYRTLSQVAAVAGARVAFTLAYADSCRATGRHHEATRVLLLGQRANPREHRLLLKLADSYRDNGEGELAHLYYDLAALIHQPYGLVRKLAFEADSGRLKDGEETLAKLLDFPPDQLLRYLSMLNRVSIRFPALASQFTALRGSARRVLRSGAFSSSDMLSERVRIAIACRWLDDAEELIGTGISRGLTASEQITLRLAKINDALGPMRSLIEAAWNNEQGSPLLCFQDGFIKPCDPDSGATQVEFFVPTPFLAFDQTEKPTYATVRSFFLATFSELASRPGVAIIPRLQLNWRNCVPRTSGRVVSYHTFGIDTPLHLRIQESTLAGCVSLDSEGFAGYSSITSAGEVIDSMQATEQEMQDTLNVLRGRYVEANTSKYTQNAQSSVKVEGRYVFVPLQVSTDIVAALSYVDALTMLKETTRHFAGTSTKVVVKRHPYCTSGLTDAELRKLEAAGDIVLSDGSVHHLIRDAAAVVTVNSGVGLEGLLQEKPVIATGASEYSYAATVCKSVPELHEALDGVSTDPARIRRFLHYYWHNYVVRIDDREALTGRINAWLDQS